MFEQLADEALKLATELWPLNRSLINSATTYTLERILSDFHDESKIHKYASGTRIGDWTIPKSWEVKSAKLFGADNEIIVDFNNNNLHLMSYSIPVQGIYSHTELMDHIYFDEAKPQWIPYRTSYYKSNWGFCLNLEQIKKLVHDYYKVEINATLQDDFLRIGEIYLPGISEKEIVFTTYVCHPSMANNELSGPVVLRALAKFICKLPNRYYSFRFLFMPETIGAIAYISNNIQKLKQNVLAGYVVTCIGDNRSWGYVPSRTGVTLADKVLTRVLQKLQINYEKYSFLERGSDERQFCSPNVDLPFASVTRSKYGTYPEYHTSGDNMSLISKDSLNESINFLIALIQEFEKNRVYQSTQLTEPFFSLYNLRDVIGAGTLSDTDKKISDIVAFADMSNDTAQFCELLNLSSGEFNFICDLLLKHDLIKLL